MIREIRTLGCEVRASPAEDGKTWRFEGYAALFDSLSEDLGGYREKIARGAFSNALRRGDDVRALFNHDPNYVMGRTTAGTLRLSEDQRGLRFELDAPDVGWVRDLRVSVQRGDVDQCSFQFMIDKESWEEKKGEVTIRTLEDLTLYDISLVTYPAYTATSAVARSEGGGDDGETPQAALRPAPQRGAKNEGRGRAGGMEDGDGTAWRRALADRKLKLKEKEGQ